MTVKYSSLNNLNLNKIINLGLFCDENFNIINHDNLGLSDKRLIANLIKNNRNQKKSILTINTSDKQNLILIKLKRNQKSIDNEKIGAKFYDYIKSNSIFDLTFIDKNFTYQKLGHLFIEEFLHGIELKSYEFKAPLYFEKAIPAISRCAHGVLFKINLCKNCAAVVDPAPP